MSGTQVHIPTIKTKRLILRAPIMDDFDAYAAMLMSERARFLQPNLTRKTAWAWFCNDVAHWQLFGFGALTITVKESGDAVGQVAITKGIAFPEPELGWLLYEGAEGQGFATEAALAVLDHARAHFGLPSLVSYVDPANSGSVGVATRLGARIDPDATAAKSTEQVWRHTLSAEAAHVA